MNPVLREHLEVSFGEGRGLPAYFHVLAGLALIQFLALCTPFLGVQVWSGAGHLLTVCASLAVLLVLYCTLRVANREYAPSRFRTVEYWVRERGESPGTVARGEVAFLAVHAAGATLLVAPLLAWAAAIAHVPAPALAAILALIPFYALCYGVWGLVVLALWEHDADAREVIVRSFVVGALIAPMALYLPLNPVAYVFALAGQQAPAALGLAAGLEWPPGIANIVFHLALGGTGLAAHRWALGRVR
ncbi:MAG: hypothetical protein IT529_01075 [Burkholderiales bacterium]|nr:hypothetical protein [Burkholderiales bacterium]